ncbi:MAG: D-isomer specific 2-hydroxyacid dehydrogenase NAD-binding [Bacillota bacterium]|jgi:gluconate 2-dehydrogenase|nr:D-isomer specific 2-hydroxyacid dehydrogenase NAD-binding [Bacillota bacterium]
MKKPKVLISKNIPKYVEDYIGEHCEYEKLDKESRSNNEILYKKVKDIEGILQSGIKIDEEFLNHATNLKVVSNISVGYDNFDLNAMKKRNIIGTNTPTVLNDSVADLIFGLMLSAARRIPELDSYVKNKEWDNSGSKNLFGIDVHHSVLGIIGMGRIGEVVAKRAKFGFDMDVLYYNRTRKYETEEKLDVKYSELNSLLKQSDFILVMTPLNDETYHLIDEDQFNLMKKTAIFINASRGATVNEVALIKALQENKILAAGLDVYEKEPVDKNNPLLNLTNVVTMPHIGSATEKTRNNMAMLAAQNMVKALLGETPPNIVSELK